MQERKKIPALWGENEWSRWCMTIAWSTLYKTKVILMAFGRVFVAFGFFLFSCSSATNAPKVLMLPC